MTTSVTKKTSSKSHKESLCRPETQFTEEILFVWEIPAAVAKSELLHTLLVYFFLFRHIFLNSLLAPATVSDVNCGSLLVCACYYFLINMRKNRINYPEMNIVQQAILFI